MKYGFLFILVFLYACTQPVATQQVVVENFAKIKGVDFTAPTKNIDSNAFLSVKNVHANWVAFMPYAYLVKNTANLKWNDTWQYTGEKREGIIQCTQIAQKQGFKIMLKPHLWLMNGQYTGDLVFENEKAWQDFETSYEKYLLENAMLADSLQIDMLCIGTELEKMIQLRPLFWEKLIGEIRKIYHGKLTYASNWDHYQAVPFWDKMDFIGIDAYFPLCSRKNPTLESLKRGWEKHINEMENYVKNQGKPVLFTEYGYRNIDFAAHQPWESYKPFPANETAQMLCYQSFFENVWHKTWFAGGFVWKWYDETNPEKRENSTDYTPQEKLAEKELAKRYKEN